MPPRKPRSPSAASLGFQVDARADPIQDARAQIFLTQVRHLLAGIELNRISPAIVSPAIRLEYLRYANNKKGSTWVSDTGMVPSTSGAWRLTLSLADAVSAKPEQQLTMRQQMFLILKKQATFEIAELPWVLNGSRPIPELETVAQRAAWTVEVALGRSLSVSTKQKGAAVGIEHDDLLRQIGIAGLAEFRQPDGSERLAQAIKVLAGTTHPVITQAWLKTGKTHPPASVASLVAFYKARQRKRKPRAKTPVPDTAEVEARFTVGVLRRLWHLAQTHIGKDDPDFMAIRLIFILAFYKAGMSNMDFITGPLSVNELLGHLKPAIADQKAAGALGISATDSALAPTLRRLGLLDEDAPPFTGATGQRIRPKTGTPRRI